MVIKSKSRLETPVSWWKYQATIYKSTLCGVIDTRWMVGILEYMQHPEISFLSKSPRMAMHIVDSIVWGQTMKLTSNVTQGDPKKSVVPLWPTLYYPWGLHPINVNNSYYVVPDAPHLYPTGYVNRHLEGHKMVEILFLPTYVINETARKTFRN